MNQYIITEEELLKLMTVEISVNDLIDLSRVIRFPPYNPQAERERVLDGLREIKEYDRIRFHQKHTLPKSWTDAKVIGVFKNGKRIGISAILPGSRCTTEMTIDVSDVRYVCRWIELREGKDGDQ